MAPPSPATSAAQAGAPQVDDPLPPQAGAAQAGATQVDDPLPPQANAAQADAPPRPARPRPARPRPTTRCRLRPARPRPASPARLRPARPRLAHHKHPQAGAPDRLDPQTDAAQTGDPQANIAVILPQCDSGGQLVLVEPVAETVEPALDWNVDEVGAVDWDALQIIETMDDEGRLQVASDDQLYDLLGLTREDERAGKARETIHRAGAIPQLEIDDDGAALVVDDHMPNERVIRKRQPRKNTTKNWFPREGSTKEGTLEEGSSSQPITHTSTPTKQGRTVTKKLTPKKKNGAD